MRFIFVCFVILLSGQIAFSQEPIPSDYAFKTRSDLNELILAMDVDAVEALFGESDQALQELGATHAGAFRTLMGSFQTTHPSVERFMPLWAESHPQSVYPMVARGFHNMHIGWFYRGGTIQRFISDEARTAYDVHFRQAARLAKTAYEMRPDLVAVADLARQVHQHGYGWRSKKEVFYETLDKHPDVATLMRSLQGLAPEWGGSLDLVFTTCDIYAPNVAADFPFDADICKASYILDWLDERQYSELSEWALDVQERTPFLANIAALEVAAPAVLEDVNSPKRLLYLAEKELERISSDAAGFGADWSAPENVIGFNKILDKAEKYGKYSQKLYRLRAEQFQNFEGLEALKLARVAHEKGIYYSNHSPIALLKYKQILGRYIYRVEKMMEFQGGVKINGVEEDYDTVMGQLRCPYLRASRILDVICPDGTSDLYCRHAGNFGALSAPEDISKQCPELASVPVRDLAFGLPH